RSSLEHSLTTTLFLSRPAAPRPPHPFPTRRSSDLAREARKAEVDQVKVDVLAGWKEAASVYSSREQAALRLTEEDTLIAGGVSEDRKSTRLNSSHVSISYAVFCLKKKTPYRRTIRP